MVMVHTQHQKQSTATKIHIFIWDTAAFTRCRKPIRGWRWISVQLSLLSAFSSPTEETAVVTYIFVCKILSALSSFSA